jgi:putative CocE/NonD family hydrolase
MSLPGPGPFDQRSIEDRADVLVYTSEPVEEDVEVTGPVRVRLWAASTAPSTDFTAKLVDVFPDGRAINLCQGVVRTCCCDGEHRVGEPGVVRSYDIDLVATSSVFLVGHRIRLEVASSCFPTYDVNPNTGRHLVNDPTNDVAVSTQTVFHDAERPSQLILPLIPFDPESRS